MSHHIKDKGDLAVAKVMAHLAEHGIRVCTPLSEHLPFDLIAVMPDMHTLRRVQMKYRKLNSAGAIDLLFRSNYYDAKKIYSVPVNLEEIDSCGVYCPNTGGCYYIRVDKLDKGAKGITLRVQPPRNHQKRKVSLVHEFADRTSIADRVQYVSLKPRTVLPQDELAVAMVIENLTEQGIYVCVSMSLYIPFDLVAVHPDMKTLQRIRVGYDRAEHTDETDLFAIYNSAKKCVEYATNPAGEKAVSSLEKLFTHEMG